MMLPRVPGKERTEFVLKAFRIMLTHGTAGMSAEAFEEFMGRLQEILGGVEPGEVAESDAAPGGG